MHLDFYTVLAAGLNILTLVLAGALLAFCVLLYRIKRNCGWLLLGCSFMSPFYRVAWRMAHGLSPLWYPRAVSSANGVPMQGINLDFPFWLAFAAVGLFLIYRKAKHE